VHLAPEDKTQKAMACDFTFAIAFILTYNYTQAIFGTSLFILKDD